MSKIKILSIFVFLSFIFVLALYYYHFQLLQKIENTKEEILILKKETNQLKKEIQQKNLEKEKLEEEKKEKIQFLELWQTEKEKLIEKIK